MTPEEMKPRTAQERLRELAKSRLHEANCGRDNAVRSNNGRKENVAEHERRKVQAIKDWDDRIASINKQYDDQNATYLAWATKYEAEAHMYEAAADKLDALEKASAPKAKRPYKRRK